MRIRSWWAALAAASVCCVTTPPILAQTAPPLVLSEADAIARLSTDSPRVRAIRSGIELARADVIAAARWPNPRVYVGREAVAGVSETISSILQPLPITGVRRFEVAEARLYPCPRA